MDTLYFCADGILRLKSATNKIFVSLDFIQKKEQLDDLAFWVKFWQLPVYFEEGLSVYRFLQCIKPWSEFWAVITQKDVQAYIKESMKPSLVNPDSLDWISLDYRTEIKPSFNYDTSELSPQWHMFGYYELAGYKYGREKHYLIEHLPLNELSNLPLILNPDQICMIDEFYIRKYGNDKGHLLNPNAIGVYTIFQNDDDEAQFSYVSGPKVHILREVIEGFFSQFQVSPEARNEMNDDIRFAIEDTIAESIHENLSMDEIQTEQRILNPETYTYDNLMKEAIKDENSALRIGKIEISQCPEKRLLNWILNEEHHPH